MILPWITAITIIVAILFGCVFCLRFGYGGAGLGKSRGEGDEEENTEAW